MTGLKSQPTFVTAFFDLGRDKLNSSFRREKSHYQEHLEKTLTIDYPLVIYTESDYIELITSIRNGKPTQIITDEAQHTLDTATLGRIDAIRNNENWLSQAEWLPQSPQAALDGYNALVFSKLFWLQEQANKNPFGSSHFYWIDAGLSHTVSPVLLHDTPFERLPHTHQQFLLLCYPYHAANEVHGFNKSALAKLSGVEETRWVARGGFFGGSRLQIENVTRRYKEVLSQTLKQDFMGTEESLFTLLSYTDPELFDLQFIEPDGLVRSFFERLKQDIPLLENSRRRLVDLTETWFISFNTPKQFSLLLKSLDRRAPEFLHTANSVLINNSTDESVFPEYDQLCEQYGIHQIRLGNMGINGARLYAAEQFYRSGRHAMFWFEDDMLLAEEGEPSGQCDNGFPRHVDHLGATCLAVQQRENLDYLKLSFTEIYGSHHEQWGWKNLSPQERESYFPGDEELPRTHFSEINSLVGTAYALGEVFYSNWPHLIVRRGTRKLFLEKRWEQVFEQYWTGRSFKLLRAGQLRASVLLASPINHSRVYEYTTEERVEYRNLTNQPSIEPSTTLAESTTAAFVSPGPQRKPKTYPYIPGTIFVSIANYRDSETPHTLRDLYARAANPERVFVGLFSQTIPGIDDDCLPIDGFPASQIRHIRIHADESLGACWARHRILTELYQGEDFILQIDSHSRFVDGWDNRCIAMLDACPSDRPLLTTYPSGYRPPDHLDPPHTPILRAYRFNEFGVLLFQGHVDPTVEFTETPQPSAFLSGNCLFGPAEAFQEVPYDPYLYFHGEEISLAVRFWTHGWDLFAPNDLLLYTDYSTDRGRPRHWDDQQRWTELNRKSFLRLRHLFKLESCTDPEAIEELQHYGLGNRRSLSEYEAIADVSFATRYFGPRASAGRFPLPGQPASQLYEDNETPSIFVSIANYRDTETRHTIRDLFARASHPERITVGVLSQIIPESDAECLAGNEEWGEQIRELRIHAAESQGVAWARHHILKELLSGEEYVLQIDSHSRFSQGWDERFIAMHKRCPSEQSVLSSRPVAYTPQDRLDEPHYSVGKAHSFTEQGVLLIDSRPIHLQDKPAEPLPSAFICAGSLFGPAQAFREVPYDPAIYFNGEEISYSARLWTHGWDIYALNDALVYHEYDLSRARPCHWDDHADWHLLDTRSNARIRHLLHMEKSHDPDVLLDIEQYALGYERTLAEYEHFSDIRFRDRHIGIRAEDGRFPQPEERKTGVLRRRMQQRFLNTPHETVETRCGQAARLSNTVTLRRELGAWLSENRIRTLIDAGCGDGTWVHAIPELERLDWYIGYDIVPELIEANQALYGRQANHLFGIADITRTPLPRSDAILCRRVLETLPVDDALEALKNLMASDTSYLIASTTPAASNHELGDSGYRQLNLCAEPFNMDQPIALLHDYANPAVGKSGSHLGVWKLRQLK